MPERLGYRVDARLPWLLTFFLIAVFALTSWDMSAVNDYTALFSAEQLEDTIRKGSIMRQVALCCLGGYGLVSLLRDKCWPACPRGLAGATVVFYVLLICASIGWTVDQELTVRAVVRLFMMSVGALAIAQQLTVRQIAKIALCVTAVTLSISILWETVEYGQVASSDWRFAGVMHPVAQGWNCAILTLSALYLSGVSRKHVGAYRLTVAVGILFLLLTKSRVAFAGTLIAMLVHWWNTRTRSERIRFVTVATPAIAALATVVAMSRPFQHSIFTIAAFGRGAVGEASMATLTGRLPLWSECIRYALQRPLVGYGYNTFLSPRILLDISNADGWMSSPHSGYIGTFLELGALGLALLGLTLVLAMYQSIRLLKRDPDQIFTLSVLVWLVINLSTESLLVTSASFPTFLVMILVAKRVFGFLPATETALGPSLHAQRI